MSTSIGISDETLVSMNISCHKQLMSYADLSQGQSNNINTIQLLMTKQTHGCGNMIKTTAQRIMKTIQKVTGCVCVECRVLLHGQSQSKVKINPLSISAA